MPSCSSFSSCVSAGSSSFGMDLALFFAAGDFDRSLARSDHVYLFDLRFLPPPNATLVETGFSFEAGGKVAEDMVLFSDAFALAVGFLVD